MSMERPWRSIETLEIGTANHHLCRLAAEDRIAEVDPKRPLAGPTPNIPCAQKEGSGDAGLRLAGARRGWFS